MESKVLRVDVGAGYDIRIEAGVLDRAGGHIRDALPRAKRLFVATDSTVGPLYYNRLKASLEAESFQVFNHIIPAGEQSKNVHTLSALWEAMMDCGLTRTDGVVALGGGVVGDLAGFAAATILRGVDLIQIPTTLLAQVDSSVGGKTAIDLEHGKNLAGSFYQPRLVLMDPETLHTLPLPVFMSGMAEVLKYGCIWSREFFDFLATRPSREALMDDIVHILYTCCDIKREVVVEDERDTARRMILNFGHTVGHAYEKAGHYIEWSHGEAVAAGMVTAAQLGVGLGVTDPSAPGEIADALAALGLPTHISCAWSDITEAVGLDKKSAGDDITLILLEEIGKVRPMKIPKEQALQNLEAVYGR